MPPDRTRTPDYQATDRMTSVAMTLPSDGDVDEAYAGMPPHRANPNPNPNPNPTPVCHHTGLEPQPSRPEGPRQVVLCYSHV
eukprot:scaffold105156_cov39-Phaeocystis_antarctica.AAC.1